MERTSVDRPDDRLSRAASALARLAREADATVDDCAAFGASDCSGLALAGVSRRALRALRRFGFTPDTFRTALRARVAPRYAADLDWTDALGLEGDEG